MKSCIHDHGLNPESHVLIGCSKADFYGVNLCLHDLKKVRGKDKFFKIKKIQLLSFQFLRNCSFMAPWILEMFSSIKRCFEKVCGYHSFDFVTDIATFITRVSCRQQHRCCFIFVTYGVVNVLHQKREFKFVRYTFF